VTIATSVGVRAGLVLMERGSRESEHKESRIMKAL
jgi:hypothetical protein